jgi:DNA-directed RNA polymerase subunit RPC12/RpoP
MSKFLVLALLLSAFVVFGSNGTLIAMTQTEDSNILIKCSTCGVEFTSKSATEVHVKGHPGHELTMPAQPLIKCSTCGVDFTSQVSLKKHLQENPEHEGAPLVKCSTCGVEFTSPGLWKEHLKKHSDHQDI